MKISLTPQAEQELVESAKFYAREAGQSLGLAFLAEFSRTTALLAEQPLIGACWRGEVRRLPLRRFPYNLIYQPTATEIRILAVAHQHRRPDFWVDRK